MYNEISKCRICGNENLVLVLNLGEQYLTGVFPKNKEQKITFGPLELVKCSDNKKEHCGLLQLRHYYDLNEMYGQNYGYRSNLNQSMVKHLHTKVKQIQNYIKLKSGDLIIDIGSNDGTLLKGYPEKDFVLLGIDPIGEKFREYYPEHINLIPDYFSADIVKMYFNDKKAKVITSIAMYYDLESPMDFMREIYDILADEGIWVFEQSYMPTMLEINAYDTICHEHLEYYSLSQIKWMTDRVGFKIIDVEFNSVNGGSFSVKVAKKNSVNKENSALVNKILREENAKELYTLKPYQEFKQRIYSHREKFVRFIHRAKDEGKTIFGYGASTKGNVILQFCNITERDNPFIAEVNRDKFGSYTPGTLIPIISEEEARDKKPDYFLVLPWHFKESIIAREQQFIKSGGVLVFPLPSIELVTA